MAVPAIEDLLHAGVHFGHQTRRWNPKMRRFIFAERNGIHIIDLHKTLRQLELAQQLAREVVLRGEQVMFVCTKRQLAAIVRDEAEGCGAQYITERWLGGLLTNFQTVKKQLRKLKDLESGAEEGGQFKNYTKKEQLLLQRKRDKLDRNLSGLKTMGRVPGLLFIVDSKKERIAVSEAKKLGIPIIAIVDTNADPDVITVPIAGNDDAIRSVELLTHAIAEAISEARQQAPSARGGDGEESESYTYSSDRGAERAAPEDATKRRRPRRRRAKPEALAAQLKGGEAGEATGDSGAEGGADAGADAGADTGSAAAPAAAPAAAGSSEGTPTAE